MFDWNDLRYFLAVARYGSTIAAGKAMGISQSTVHRRLEELESQLKRKLVTRETTGYRVTEFGQELLAYAERIERGVLDFEQHAQDSARDLTGVIRITCPEPIIARFSNAKFIDGFHTQYPQLRVEFVTSDRYLSIVKGEADIAFRSGDTDDDLVQVLGPVPELTRSWRLLTHPDLRQLPRISAFFDYCFENIETLKAILGK